MRLRFSLTSAPTGKENQETGGWGSPESQTQVVRSSLVKTLPLFVLLLIGAFVAGGFTFSRFRNPGRTVGQGSAEPVTHNAEAASSPLNRAAVTALGRLEPASRVIRVGGTTGDRMGELLVREGQRVKGKQVLAYLQSRAERQAECQQIEASLKESQAQLKAETAYGAALVREAEFHVEQAERLHPLKVASQQAQVRALEAEVATAKKDLERAKPLRENGTITEAEWDSQSLLVRQREEALQSGRATLEELEAERDLELSLAKVEVEQSKAAMARAQALVAVDSLEKRLRHAEERLEQSIIRAPLAGRVLKILTWPGESITEEPILQLGDTDEMHAVTEVYETDVMAVRVGQPATIESPALPRAMKGRVVHIGNLIYKNDVLDVDPASEADARVIEVRIRLDEPALAARLTNLQVRVRIDVKTAAGSAKAAAETVR